MINQSALLDAYEEFGKALLRPYEIGDVLYRLTDQVVAVLDIDGAGVCLARDDGGLELLSTSDHHIAAIDDAQLTAGEGPVHRAYADNEQVIIDDLGEVDEWPEFRRAAGARNLAATAALPMPVDERRIGALTLYRGEPHAWADDEIQAGQSLANMASAYVLNHQLLSESTTLANQLHGALESRVIVEQAKGLLCGRHDITPNEAFGRLRTFARNNGEGLHEVCARVVDGSLDV